MLAAGAGGGGPGLVWPRLDAAATLGFSNVMVGVSIADMVRGLAVAAAQGAAAAGVAAGVDKAGSKKKPVEEPERPNKGECNCNK